MKSKSITVALVEDVAGTRESLQALLGRVSALRCVAACATGEQAMEELPALRPDVVLMDINLPGMSGIECVAKLKRELPKTQILILTTYQDSDLIFDSLRAGASGYLLKNSTPSEITQAIEQVRGGGSPMSVHIARKVVNYFQERDQQSDSELARLTAREQEVLALLAKGFLYKEIADQMGVTLSTVRAHLHAVYEKLHVQSRTEAVVKYLKR
jgi:DNA-binding NarL/FixJ family response regulator